MKTPFTLLALSRCPWYTRTKRQSPSNIFFTILIYFLAHFFSLESFKSTTISSSLSSADIGTESVVYLLIAAIVARYFLFDLCGMWTENVCGNSWINRKTLISKKNFIRINLNISSIIFTYLNTSR